MTEKVISPELQRRREAAAALADKYVGKDGGKPDLEALAKLSPVDYGAVRAPLADKLGIGVKFLDDELKGRRRLSGRSAERPYWDVEPSADPVNGDVLLKALMRRLQRHVVMDDDQALAVALWIVLAWTHDAATHSPILLVSSPEAECGKTTLLGLVQLLAAKGLLFVDTSPAVVYRMIESWHPTLIVDEADVLFRDNPELRSVINSGWTRGAGVPRCNPETNEPEFFETFGPKAIGLKGLRLPDTTLSRSIVIDMQRKLPVDKVADFDHLDSAPLAELRSFLARFAHDNIEQLRRARPKLPEGFHNRLAANWRLMLAIADHCGAGDEARAAAEKLARRADDASLGVELLRDVRDIFDRLRSDRITSEQLVKELGNMLDRPWCEMPKSGKPITQRSLAGLLKDYKVKPKQVRFDAVTLKGYLLEWFEKAFRYIPEAGGRENKRNRETTAENGQNIRNKADPNVSDKMAENGQCFPVSHESPLAPTDTHKDPFPELPEFLRRCS